MSNALKLVIAIAAIVVLSYAALAFDWFRGERVDDFATCAAAGYPVGESYPRQCKDKSGVTYMEETGTSTADSSIEAASPKEGDAVSSPVAVSGRARGTWFFEASFPIQVIGADGKTLGAGAAKAQGDWMTQNFVPFEASIAFDPGTNATGTIRLKRDNPSGAPQNDAFVDIPVSFSRGKPAQAACRPSGCSGEICSDGDAISNCVYKPQFACYKTAKCERQQNGKCGWTETPALASCLANPPKK